MIQDIFPHVFHNEFHERESLPGDFVAVFSGGKTYLSQGGALPTAAEIKALGVKEHELVYLFEIDQTAFFLLWTVPDAVKTALVEQGTGIFRNMKPTYLALAGSTALHLSAWYRSNRFCGRCGAAMERDKVERAMRCPSCDQVVYPRINPAVLAAVRHRDKLLLTHYANRPNATRYALVAASPRSARPWRTPSGGRSWRRSICPSRTSAITAASPGALPGTSWWAFGRTWTARTRR